mmetsp:Transcript_1910/g.4888  ORF Transcript_1910/g.4888 Transcript_1910/m.4888 type:complete len:219 (-) Transcript_1910:554-1210(-)
MAFFSESVLSCSCFWIDPRKASNWSWLVTEQMDALVFIASASTWNCFIDGTSLATARICTASPRAWNLSCAASQKATSCEVPSEAAASTFARAIWRLVSSECAKPNSPRMSVSSTSQAFRCVATSSARAPSRVEDTSLIASKSEATESKRREVASACTCMAAEKASTSELSARNCTSSCNVFNVLDICCKSSPTCALSALPCTTQARLRSCLTRGTCS